MTPAVAIRRIDAHSTGLLDRIAEDVFDAPIDPARLAAFVATPLHLLVVAVQDGIVVGQCVAMVHRHPDTPAELYIDNLGVTPGLWRKGIGTRLLEEALAWGKEMGCAEAWVGTEPGNAAAQSLYWSLEPAESATFAFYAYDLSVS